MFFTCFLLSSNSSFRLSSNSSMAEPWIFKYPYVTTPEFPFDFFVVLSTNQQAGLSMWILELIRRWKENSTTITWIHFWPSTSLDIIPVWVNFWSCTTLVVLDQTVPSQSNQVEPIYAKVTAPWCKTNKLGENLSNSGYIFEPKILLNKT